MDHMWGHFWPQWHDWQDFFDTIFVSKCVSEKTVFMRVLPIISLWHTMVPNGVACMYTRGMVGGISKRITINCYT